MMTGSLDRAPSDAEECVPFVETMLSSRPMRSACLASTPQKPQNMTSTARAEERRLRYTGRATSPRKPLPNNRNHPWIDREENMQK